MLLYPRSFSSMGLLFTCAGSALPRATIPAFISTLFSMFLVILQKHSYIEYMIEDTYPYQVFAYMLGVGLAFRTNVAYTRYWEGIGHFKTFTSKWGDSAAFVLSFDRHAKQAVASENKVDATRSVCTQHSMPR